MHKKILALFLAAAMGLSLVACGGTTGESSDTASDSAATSDAAADAADDIASGETIKIGFLTPMSGANATYGLQVKAAGEMMASVINEEHPEMAVALAKEAGLPNLNGAKIELVFADSKQDPTTAASEAKTTDHGAGRCSYDRSVHQCCYQSSSSRNRDLWYSPSDGRIFSNRLLRKPDLSGTSVSDRTTTPTSRTPSNI